ncbi:MAG TPA: hydroxyacid dehydrogenase [Verrucomicrobiae bacterium]|nr:hydroxyacid dehydrogenase [Verrucomicrobiae bacterium]
MMKAARANQLHHTVRGVAVRPLGGKGPKFFRGAGRDGKRLKGLYILDKGAFELVYGAEEQREIAELVDIVAPLQTRESIARKPWLLAPADVIFSGWGAPVMDKAFLQASPRLQAVFYGAGSIRPITSAAFWERNIIITSASAANAVPVAEYTLGVILLSLKRFWSYAVATRKGEGWADHTRSVPGGYRSTVGLVSVGVVARKVLELLAPFDIRRIVYCPFLTADEARQLRVERCSLPDVFKLADVVSIHTPKLTGTRGLVTGRHIASMKRGGTLINTARGAIIREQEMIDVLRQRRDLTAVLDVTDPEPPALDSPLLTLPNVVLTPHIAGSLGAECGRMGRCMVEELRRFVAGKPLKWQITAEAAARLT